MSGLGNAFLGFRGGFNTDMVRYSSTLEFGAPTGDTSRGFSTGRMTVDWTNHFSHKFGSFTPFGSAGIANTVSDTNFFLRPFSSLGVAAHFEGGATYDVRRVQFGASAYSVRGSGEQHIISKIIDQSTQQTTSDTSTNRGNGNSRVFDTKTVVITKAEVVNDHGYSTWFGVYPGRDVDFHAGYSRSVNYDFNSFFFGVGFHVGK